MVKHTYRNGAFKVLDAKIRGYESTFDAWFDKAGVLVDAQAINRRGHRRDVASGSLMWFRLDCKGPRYQAMADTLGE